MNRQFVVDGGRRGAVPGFDIDCESTAQAQSGQYYDRSFVVAGQRVTHAVDATKDQSEAFAGGQSGVSAKRRDGVSTKSHSVLSWAADTDNSSVASTARTITATFRHVAFGLAVGGVLTFFGTLFVAGLAVALEAINEVAEKLEHREIDGRAVITP